MRIGIVTLIGNHNYGNRLQNYALEQVLKTKGTEVRTIEFDRTLPLSLKQSVKKPFSLVLNMLVKKRRMSKKMYKIKEKEIYPFTEKYLNNISYKTQNLENFDLFFVGSDQVWNPHFSGDKSDLFLEFAPKNKRFSYAASFGVSEIPNEFKKGFSQFLSNMNKISVREEAGVRIVDDLTSKKATLVPDPTMLLTRLEWETLIESSKGGNVRTLGDGKLYILLYLLHGLTRERKSKIEKFAKKKGYVMIEIMGNFFDEKHLAANPIEFLELVKNAEMVFTDSFHCGVFSIIFHIPFVVFERNDGAKMASRLHTLLKRFDLNDNLYTEETDFENLKSLMDFSRVDVVLEGWRQVGMDFIDKSLESAK